MNGQRPNTFASFCKLEKPGLYRLRSALHARPPCTTLLNSEDPHSSDVCTLTTNRTQWQAAVVQNHSTKPATGWTISWLQTTWNKPGAPGLSRLPALPQRRRDGRAFGVPVSGPWSHQEGHLAGRHLHNRSATPLELPGTDWGGDPPPDRE